MLKETQRGREYRMDAAQDCLTVSLLCLMAPCRKPERQHCTTLYGLLTRPRCIWWTSLCRTGTFQSHFHQQKKARKSRKIVWIGVSFSCRSKSCEDFFQTRHHFRGKSSSKQQFLLKRSASDLICLSAASLSSPRASVCSTAADVQRKA